MNPMVQLRCGDARARLVSGAGGRISALRLVRPGGGVVDILHPYPEDFFDPIRWAKGGIYPLMPYSNRIAQATVTVNGEAFALTAHPDAAPHSLHGNALSSCGELPPAAANQPVDHRDKDFGQRQGDTLAQCVGRIEQLAPGRRVEAGLVVLVRDVGITLRNQPGPACARGWQRKLFVQPCRITQRHHTVHLRMAGAHRRLSQKTRGLRRGRRRDSQ